MRITTLLILLLVLSCNCRKEPPSKVSLIIENNIIISKPFLWKTLLSDGEWIGGFVTETAVHNNALLMGSIKGKVASFCMVNTVDGSVQWEKPGYSGNDFCPLQDFYVYGSYVVFQHSNGPASSNLNLKTGEYLWDIRRNVPFESHVTGIDSFFFVCGPSQKENNPYKINAAYFGKVNKSDIQEFYFPDIEPVKDSTYINGAGGVQYILPCKNTNGDILLVIYYTKNYPLPGKAFFSLYNFTKKQIVYEKKPMSIFLTGPPAIYNNRIYNATASDMSCIDLFTGEIVWANKRYNGFSSYGFTIGDGKLVALYEGTDPKSVIAYNLETGTNEWKTDSHGTISPMRFLNGVVYFASSGDGRLHAIDAANGKYLWQIKSPDLKINSGGFFKPECNVIPGKNGEKGKVIVSSYFSGICYEAER